MKDRFIYLIDDHAVSYHTDPTDPDTDDDGYWDGWIGVYDVNRTDNVIVYEENLHDDDDGDGSTTDDGVQGDEIVQEQIQYHNVTAVSSAGGADINGDGVREHSNLHLGELYWGTEPDDDSHSETPSPGASIEVDYYEDANLSLDHPDWRQTIENNYRIYGIDLSVERDEIITNSSLRTDVGGISLDATSPFTESKLFGIENAHHDTSADYYLFVASTAGGDLSSGQTGIHRWSGIPSVDVDRYTVVFTEGHSNQVGDVPRHVGLSGNETIRAATAKTAVHEIGHIFDLGEDDDRGNEVYSGSTRANESDFTPEQVIDRISGNPVQRWSVMSSGVNGQNFTPPTNESFTALSIEEWKSITYSRLGESG